MSEHAFIHPQSSHPSSSAQKSTGSYAGSRGQADGSSSVSKGRPRAKSVHDPWSTTNLTDDESDLDQVQKVSAQGDSPDRTALEGGLKISSISPSNQETATTEGRSGVESDLGSHIVDDDDRSGAMPPSLKSTLRHSEIQKKSHSNIPLQRSGSSTSSVSRRDSEKRSEAASRGGKASLRENISDIILDPFTILHSFPSSPINSGDNSADTSQRAKAQKRQDKFLRLLRLEPSSSSSHTSLLSLPSDSSIASLSMSTSTQTPQTPMTPFTSFTSFSISAQSPSQTHNQSPPTPHKFSSTQIDLQALKKLSWKGVPADLRALVWPLLLGVYPVTASPPRRRAVIARKRAEYASSSRASMPASFESTLKDDGSSKHASIWAQIRKDVPRTSTGVSPAQRSTSPYLQPSYSSSSIIPPTASSTATTSTTSSANNPWAYPTTQRALERILLLWSLRHPATGYVQGINDLLTPLFTVFLSAYLRPDADIDAFDPALLPPAALAAVEADTYYALTALLESIADHYTPGQPGIMRGLTRLQALIQRTNPPLHAHLAEQGVQFSMFGFRWWNCLLLREFRPDSILRMWDTYLAEGIDLLPKWHLYVCAAFLRIWAVALQNREFQDILLYLQAAPTSDWTDADVDMLLADAFVLKAIWEGTRLDE